MEGKRFFLVTTGIKDNPVWDPPDFKLLGLFLYLMATAKEEQRAEDSLRRITWNGKERALQAGQFTFALRPTAEILEWSKSKLHRQLKALEDLGVITLEPAKGGTRFSVVTLCKWNDYQPDWPGSETPVKRQRDASETPAGHPKREIEREKDKNPPTPLSPAHMDRLLRVYDGCQHWSEAGGKQALRWAGDKAEEFLDFAQGQRDTSRDPIIYMPKPVNLYRRWKDKGSPANGSRAGVKNPNKAWKVQVVEGHTKRTISVRESDLEAKLNELRAQYGESSVRVIS